MPPTYQQLLADFLARQAVLEAQKTGFVAGLQRAASSQFPYASDPQGLRNTYRAIVDDFKAGRYATVERLDEMQRSGQGPWGYLGEDANAVYAREGSAGIRKLQDANRSAYSSFLAKQAELVEFGKTVAEAKKQYEQQQANTGGNTGGTTDGGTTPPPPPPPPDQPPPEPPAPQQVLQSEERGRVRRDISRVAFGNPRFGVGLNIPLGT